MLRVLATTALAAGFLLLAIASLLRDPAALDADIGSGVLTLVGLPLGLLGLILTILDGLQRNGRRRSDAVER